MSRRIRSRGRPCGRRYGSVVRLRLAADDLAALREQAGRSGVSVSELVRSMIRECLEDEGAVGGGGQRAMG